MRAASVVGSIVATALFAGSAIAAPPHRRPPEVAPIERRPPAPSPPRVLQPDAKPFTIDLRDLATECRAQGWNRARSTLLALENDSSYMSLELWGDRQTYAVGDQVLFYMRSPRVVYVTLYWLGPEGHLVVAMDNARIPADRDVTVDTGGVVVPPLGTEQWIAVATLEPIPVGCRSEAALLKNLQRRLALPRAIGRWKVVSVAKR